MRISYESGIYQGELQYGSVTVFIGQDEIKAIRVAFASSDGGCFFSLRTTIKVIELIKYLRDNASIPASAWGNYWAEKVEARII